jgi:transcriptional regulator with XRE-family HTH domain
MPLRVDRTLSGPRSQRCARPPKKLVDTEIGLSQEQLAEESGLHRTYVSGVERGERNLGVANVYRLARALHMSGSELLAAAESSHRKR